MTQYNLDQIADEAKKWLSSKNGEATLNNAIKEVKQMSSDLQKARELKPESFYEPVTL